MGLAASPTCAPDALGLRVVRSRVMDAGWSPGRLGNCGSSRATADLCGARGSRSSPQVRAWEQLCTALYDSTTRELALV